MISNSHTFEEYGVDDKMLEEIRDIEDRGLGTFTLLDEKDGVFFQCCFTHDGEVDTSLGPSPKDAIERSLRWSRVVLGG